MKPMVQQTFGPLPLNRVDGRSDNDLNEVEMPLAEAKQAVAGVVQQAIKHGDAGLKRFGDKGQVSRWCSGAENPNLARLWQHPRTRRELILAMAEADGMDVEVTVRVRRTA